MYANQSRNTLKNTFNKFHYRLFYNKSISYNGSVQRPNYWQCLFQKHFILIIHIIPSIDSFYILFSTDSIHRYKTIYKRFYWYFFPITRCAVRKNISSFAQTPTTHMIWLLMQVRNDAVPHYPRRTCTQTLLFWEFQESAKFTKFTSSTFQTIGSLHNTCVLYPCKAFLVQIYNQVIKYLHMPILASPCMSGKKDNKFLRTRSLIIVIWTGFICHELLYDS